MSSVVEGKLLKLVYLFAIMLGVSISVNFSVLVLLIRLFFALQKYLP